MKSKKITQEKLAEMLGVTQGAVGHWLSGRREPGMAMVMSIAKCIGMPFVEMTSGLILHADSNNGETDLSWKLTKPQKADFVLTRRMDYVEQNNPSSLLLELQSRVVPPHIEQAIMALLQTCQKREEKPKQNASVFTDEEQMRNVENLRKKLSPDQLRDFDGWLEFVRTNGQHGLPSSAVYVVGVDPLPTSGDLPKPKGKTASY